MTYTNNQHPGAFVSTAWSSVVFSDNQFDSTVTTTTIDGSQISDNIIDDGFNTGANAITNSKVSGNIFEDVDLEYVDNVVWCNNRHSIIMDIYNTSAATPCASQFNCSNNLFEGGLRIRHSDAAKLNNSDSLLEV